MFTENESANAILPPVPAPPSDAQDANEPSDSTTHTPDHELDPTLIFQRIGGSSSAELRAADPMPPTDEPAAEVATRALIDDVVTTVGSVDPAVVWAASDVAPEPLAQAVVPMPLGAADAPEVTTILDTEDLSEIVVAPNLFSDTPWKLPRVASLPSRPYLPGASAPPVEIAVVHDAHRETLHPSWHRITQGVQLVRAQRPALVALVGLGLVAATFVGFHLGRLIGAETSEGTSALAMTMASTRGAAPEASAVVPEEAAAPTPVMASATGPAPAASGNVVFDRTAAVAALISSASAARACFAEGEARSVVHTAVTFAPDGSVTSAAVEGAPLAGTKVGACIAESLRSAAVPAFVGGPITVRKKLLLP